MRWQVCTITLLAFFAGAPVLAGENGGGKSNGSGHRRVWCPHCGEACYPTVIKGTERKHWWHTESKPICIPKVRFPWESVGKGKGFERDRSVTPKCGRTKYVNVLIKHDRQHSVCQHHGDPSSFRNPSPIKNPSLFKNPSPIKITAKSDSKYLDAPELAAADPAVPTPPSVEARRQPAADYLRIVDRDRTRHEVSSSQSTSNGNASRFSSSFFR